MNTTISDYVMTRTAVDAHEHLMPEASRLALQPDVVWLFHQYAHSDLVSAGMPARDAQAVLGDHINNPGEMPLEKRWSLFKPFLDHIRHTGYARAVFLAIHDLYGADTLDDTTYAAITERIRAENTPGITDRCLRIKGHIAAILNCNYQAEQPVPYSHPLMSFPAMPRHKTAERLRDLEILAGEPITGLDGLIESVWKELDRYRATGVIGLKTVAGVRSAPTPAQARAAFAHYLSGDRTAMTEDDYAAVNDFLFDQVLQRIPEYRFTIAVHCGYLAGWNEDFTRTHARHMIPSLRRHPEVRFDLFHLNYPWMDEAIAIGKQFTNVSLNLAWCHILNPCAAERAMIELIHAVPINKVLAMGGDYWRLPDVAYGHLKLARMLFARALCACIDERWITEPEARSIADCWLHDNAYEHYPLLPRS